MTKPSKISGPRRKLLKSITLGGGTVIAGQAMPRSWTRPVVESVVLPVHAQTSGEQGSGPAPVGCSTLSISVRTLSCDNPQLYEQYVYRVDDTGECPVVIDLSQEDEDDLPDPVYLVRVDDNVETLGVYPGDGGLVRLHSITCRQGQLTDFEGVGDDLQGSFLSELGETWTASYSVTADSNGLIFSDIVLQPA